MRLSYSRSKNSTSLYAIESTYAGYVDGERACALLVPIAVGIACTAVSSRAVKTDGWGFVRFFYAGCVIRSP
ncbi:hypothetical protein AGMMS49992_25280 [Clostridia bacterium]|nr:hypothetical protein AGMMS49992_25280 [Clostridia bacterium]